MSGNTLDLAQVLLRGSTRPVRAVLERALSGSELEEADLIPLLGAQGRDLQLLCAVSFNVFSKPGKTAVKIPEFRREETGG